MKTPKCKVTAHFGHDSLTFTFDEKRKNVSFAYRDNPEVFGHPRFLIADFDKGVALVRSALHQLVGRWALIPPCIFITVERPLAGGITVLDNWMLAQIFNQGGARGVVLKNA